MALGLILEFDGIGRATYDTVNLAAGIDVSRPSQQWPAGLLYHAAGAKAGGWVVFEVWDSKEAQARFMAERLGDALARAGVAGPPARAEWLELAAHTLTGNG
jgi:hypothetical protein